MKENLIPPSANIYSCTPDHLAVISWYRIMEPQGLYPQPMLDAAVSRALTRLDKAKMDPGSVTIPEKLPETIRASLATNELRLAYDEELKRLEARQLESRRAIVSAQLGEAIDKSFAKEETTSSTSRNLQPILVPKEIPPLRTVIKNVLIDLQDAWKYDFPLVVSSDKATQLKEGVGIVISKLRQKFTFKSRVNRPILAQHS